MNRNLIGGVVILGVCLKIAFNSYIAMYPVEVVYAAEPEAPRVVQIEVVIEWTPERIEQEIRATFPEQPELMLRVARCESGLLPHAYNPTNGSHDGGIFQISEKYHGEQLDALGLDRFDIKDNLAYARMLYDKNGLRDWSASRDCWE